MKKAWNTKVCEELYARECKRVNWYLNKYFSRLKYDDRHDVMQEVWRRVSEHARELEKRSEGEQWEWLKTVCRNETIKLYRKKQHWVLSEEEMEEYAYAGNVSVEDEVIAGYVGRALLSELTEEEKQLLLASAMRGKAEGKERKSNADTCKLYRTRQKAKKILENWGYHF